MVTLYLICIFINCWILADPVGTGFYPFWKQATKQDWAIAAIAVFLAPLFTLVIAAASIYVLWRYFKK